jgi:hypothetical protein
MLKFLDYHVLHIVAHFYQFHLNQIDDYNGLKLAHWLGSFFKLLFLHGFCSLLRMLLRKHLKSPWWMVIPAPSLVNGNDCGNLVFLLISGASPESVLVLGI